MILALTYTAAILATLLIQRRLFGYRRSDQPAETLIHYTPVRNLPKILATQTGPITVTLGKKPGPIDIVLTALSGPLIGISPRQPRTYFFTTTPSHRWLRFHLAELTELLTFRFDPANLAQIRLDDPGDHVPNWRRHSLVALPGTIVSVAVITANGHTCRTIEDLQTAGLLD